MIKTTKRTKNGFKMDTARKFDLMRKLNVVPLEKRHTLSLLNLKISESLEAIIPPRLSICVLNINRLLYHN